MSKKKKKDLEAQSSEIQQVDDSPVPQEEAVEECPLKRQVKITPKIDVEYLVVLLDRNLNQYKEESDEDLFADPTAVELWIEQDKPAAVFDQGAKVSLSGAGQVEVFEDKELTSALDLNKVIPKELITDGNKLRVYVKGKTAGKFTITLTAEPSSNGDFIIQDPATQEMGVVELKLKIHEQNKSSLADLEVDPDTDPIATYHTNLKNKAMPEQKVLSDEDKVKRGRLVHTQIDNNHGRAKLILSKIEASHWPAGCDDYDLVVTADNTSGECKVFDAEFDGSEKRLPFKTKKKDLTEDKVYWVEGSSVTDKLRDIRLDYGLDRAEGGMEKEQKFKADWARISVVSIKEVKLDYKPEEGKPSAWDSSTERFFINLKTAGDGRKIKMGAKLSKAIPGIVLHFMLVEDQNNRKSANWGGDLPNDDVLPQKWIWKNITSVVKHLDKSDRKKVLHVSAATDDKGYAEKEVTLSQFGGDKFYLAAYLNEDPHLAKFVHEHSDLGKRKPVMADHAVNIWRKFWYQEIKVEGIDVAGFGDAADTYEDVKAVMVPATVVEMSRSTADGISPPCIYPKHMLSYYYDRSAGAYVNNYANDTSDGLMVGDATESTFFALSTSSDETPVMVPMLNANGLWIAKGNTAAQTSPRWVDSGDFPIAFTTDKKLLDPPLQGGTLYRSGQYMAEDWDPDANDGAGAWGNRRTVNLSAGDVDLDPGRNDPKKVRVNLPSGLVVSPNGTRLGIRRLVLRGAASYLGTSYDDGIVNTYTPNDEVDFINTINHEVGHSFKQVAKVRPAGVPVHPYQYDRNGSHCDYPNKSCLMYESGPQPASLNRYCPVCHPHVLVQDMSEV